MKNLIGYIFGLAFSYFLMEIAFIDIAKQNGSGNMFAYTLFFLGFLGSFIGIITEAWKLISKINLHNSKIK